MVINAWVVLPVSVAIATTLFSSAAITVIANIVFNS
jgi:hypothetical protein